MKPTTRKFLEHITSELIAKKVAVNLVFKPYLLSSDSSDNISYNGAFHDNPPLLECAMAKPESQWLYILAHEYCHFLQWKTKSKCWEDCYIENDEDAVAEFFSWVGGKKLTKKKARRVTIITVDLELECEKMAVKVIKKFNLNINVDKYIQKSNAYVWFYSHMLTSRKWYTPGNAPYTFKQIVNKMPKHFNNDYLNPPDWYGPLVSKYCYNENNK